MEEENTQDKQSEIPAAYRRLTVIEQVDLATWEKILNAAGEGEYLPKDGLTKKSLSSFIRDRRYVNNQLIFSLKVIFELGDYAGRNLFQQAADDISEDLQTSDDESDRELAARVWLLSRRENKYLRILNRAIADYEYSHKSNSVREYAGESSFEIKEIDEDVIKNKVTEWCQENNKNGVAQLDIAEKAGIFWCYIYRGEPIKKVPIITDENKRGQLTFHPEACDLVRIDPETGRIGIVTRSDKLRDVYRGVLGDVLTGNSDYFSGENICTLEPLQEKGSRIFEENPPISFHTIRVTELKWVRDRRDTIIVRGKNCLKILEDLNLSFKTGELIEAKLAFEGYSSRRPSRVTIKVPNRIDIQHDENEDEINRYLTVIGIRGRFDSGFMQKDFWALSPWEFSEIDWRHQIGSDFDILKKTGCFKEIDLPSVRHPNHSTGAGDMTVEQIEKGEYIGISDDPDIGVRTLTATDRKGYKLDFQKIVGEIGKKLGLNTDGEIIANEIISLGSWSQSLENIQVYLAISEPLNDSLALINDHSKGRKHILIIPEMCPYKGNIPCVSVKIPDLYFNDLLGDIVRALGIEKEIPPPIWHQEDLIIDCGQNRVWFKGCEILKLDPLSHPFKFALHVAKANGNIVKKDELNKLLSPSSHDDRVASKAKADFLTKVKESFDAVGKGRPDDISKIFRTITRVGYAVNCSATVL